MGHRITKIYSRSGDSGQTSLGNGQRVDKDCARIEALGTIEELNAQIGIVLSTAKIPKPIAEYLVDVQHQLFDLASEISIPNYQIINEKQIDKLEAIIDNFSVDLPLLREFGLPNGGPATTQCYLAHAICKRAERRMLTLHKEEAINPHCLAYLNRLTDLLLVLARLLVRTTRATNKAVWQKKHTRAELQ